METIVHAALPSQTDTAQEVEPNAFTNRKGELHFFVIWEYGRPKEKEILDDIGNHFEILECFDILWNPKLVINNFCRLYNVRQKLGKSRVAERGSGRFLLVTVWDDKPVYELAEAISGFEVVNINMLERKKQCRKWSDRKDSNIIHSSVTPEETNWNLTLLLGKNTADYLTSVKKPWDGSIIKMDRDLLGADGWNSLEEVFYALNNTVNYAVLRNFEVLPRQFDPSLHKDIDILTDNRDLLARISNAEVDSTARSKSIRTMLHINVAGQNVDLHTHDIEDNYYCTQWGQDMLRDRILSPSNIYVLNAEHHFFSLVYHVLIQKNFIAKKYYTQAEQLLESLLQMGAIRTKEGEKEAFPEIFDYYFALLNEYMKRQNYIFCRTVYKIYNPVVQDSPLLAEQLEKRFGLSQVKPIHVSKGQGIKGERLKYSRSYFQGWLNDRKIFIKHGGHVGGTHKTEYLLCNRLHKINAANFPEAVYYSNVKEYRSVAYEFLEGETLETKIKNNDLSPSERENVIIQLNNITKNLWEAGVVHRDLHPGNILIMKDGTIKLIDFGWAVDIEQYEECRAIKKNPFLFRLLRERFAGWYCSDDIFSMMQILESIGCQESYEKTYRDFESFLQQHLGKRVVTFKYRYSIFFYRLLRDAKKIAARFPWKKLKAA